MDALITAWEVVKYSPLKNDFPVSYLCGMIRNKEEKIFNSCLGLKFYTTLLEDKKDYGNVNDYNGSLTYDLNDLVVLDGTIFKSIIGSNTSSPSDDTAWTVAPKFTTAIYNDLWDLYLSYFIAYNVAYTSVNYATWQAGAKGIMKYITDETGQGTVSRSDMNQYKSSLWDDAQDILENMNRWMADHKTDFSDIDFVCGGACKVKRRTRIAFRV